MKIASVLGRNGRFAVKSGTFRRRSVLQISGLANYQKGQYEQAISDYTKALEINPEDGGFYYARGVTYYLKKEYEKSWEDVRKTQSLGCPIHPKFLNDLLEASGRKSEVPSLN